MTDECLSDFSKESSATILVVDDDPSNIQLLYSMLDGDYRIVVANSGAQALSQVERSPHIDLILLDVDMPEISGFDVLTSLRSDSKFQALPIIMVTGQNNLEHEAKALEQGANDFISKPVTAPTVKARIKTQLSLAASTRTITRKNEELELSFTKLQKAKDELSEFMALVSHELRTPIAILQCETELLCDQIRKPTEQNLSSLLDEVKHVSALIKDMFDLVLSETNALRYEKEPCSLADLIYRSSTLFETQFLEKKLDIELKLDSKANVPVYGDTKRLRQVIDNLLGNSLKYTDSGGKIKVSLNTFAEGLEVCFEDSAPSVPEGDLDKLFDRFFRVEKSRNRSTGGSGLGLAICKTIIEAHDGHISAEHSTLGGLKIKIQLPIIEQNSVETPTAGLNYKEKKQS